MVITVGRQFGSGGREIGEKLAKALGYAFYDEELVQLAAEKSELSATVLKQVDEQATKSFLYSLVMGAETRGASAPLHYELPIQDKLFIAQSEVIKDLAKKGDCVIVGRCADYVLQDTDVSHVDIFVYAPMKARIERVAKLYDLPEKKAREQIQKTEKQRRTFYNYYSNQEWGNPENYDLCIDSSRIGVEGTVEILKSYVERIKK